MKFIVDRKTWFRGRGSDESQLLRPDGQRCCIGFVGAQVGLSDHELLGVKAVAGCKRSTTNQWPKWATIHGGESIQRAYIINDDPSISDDTREAKLKAIFAAEGDEIEFIN